MIDVDKFKKLVKQVHENANQSEIDAMNAYITSGMDSHCYQEDFYKVWADERIKELEAEATANKIKFENEKKGLEEKLKIAIHELKTTACDNFPEMATESYWMAKTQEECAHQLMMDAKGAQSVLDQIDDPKEEEELDEAA